MTGTRPLTPRIFSSIRQVPPQDWDALVAGRSYTFSRAFWEVIETSGLNDFVYRHVIFYDASGRPAALASYYSITTDIAIFAPAWLRRLLSAVRRSFPGFLKLRMLECGTPTTMNSPPFAARADVPPGEVIAALHETLQSKAKEDGCLLSVLRDFEMEEHGLHRYLGTRGYHWVDGLPNTYLDIPWRTPAEYVDAMKSYFRCKLIKHLRRNEEQRIRHDLVEDFGGLADTLCAQWLVVHNQADEVQREVLTPAFYREFSSLPGARSRALLFYSEDRLVGHALLLLDGDVLRWCDFGRAEAVNDSLYIYVTHKVVETAILLGAKRLELGTTTYPVKLDLGARMTPIKLALRSPYRLINPLVGLFYPLLNHVPKISERDVFKTPADIGQELRRSPANAAQAAAETVPRPRRARG